MLLVDGGDVRCRTRGEGAPVKGEDMFDKCVNCLQPNLRDYPACINCETKSHFDTQEYCRCVRETCQRKRRIAQTDALYLLGLAQTLAASLAKQPELQQAVRRVVAHYAGEVNRTTAEDWCEACFDDHCKHVVSTY